MTTLFYLSSLNFDGLAQFCEPARLATGDEHLTFRDLIQHKVLPACIQLRQNIIQQKDGKLTGLLFHQRSLGKLQADGGRPHLSLGTEGFDGHTV